MLETSEHSISPAESLIQLSEVIKLELIGLENLRTEISRVIIGQEKMIDSLFIALLTNGHILLEGTPGLAKTLAIKTLSKCVDVSFSRIQFTPDLLPADLTGTMIYKQKSETFDVKKGPIFASFILADEINRAPAKVQSALLEAMQEQQITIGDVTLELPDPFLVLATQNPLEQEGTYPLPEAQLDRFMLKINLSYPAPSEEKIIIRQAIRSEDNHKVAKIFTKKDIFRMRDLVKKIYLDEKIEQYIVNIISATRAPEKFNQSGMLVYGASPRGSINLALAGKAYAFLKGRSFVIPDDIRAMAVDVLQHRVGLSYEAEAERITAKQVIERLVSVVEVP